jgi:hypothetical protein
MSNADAHLGQRYHGPGSDVFRQALLQTPLAEMGYEPCAVCGHECFFEQRARALTSVLQIRLICVECAVKESGADPATVMNLEPCPSDCAYR